MALTKIGYTLIKDNFKDSVSGSSTAHSSSFSTRVTTAESELGNTLLSGSAQIASNISGSRDATSISGSRDATSISGSRDAASISGSRDAASISGSLGANAGVIRTLSAATVSGSLGANAGVIRTLSAATVSGSRDVASISGSFGNQRVGTTDDVKFANITGSNDISASGNLSITGNVDVDGTSNFAGNVTLQNDLTVTGRIDAEEIHTTFISSSITQATGSNIFGDSVNDLHQFTGSIDVSGSGTVLKVSDGNVVVSDTLTATNIGAFTAAGAIDFDDQNMTNVDIDSGTITGLDTDLAVADGGTGASSFTDGYVLLGSGTSAITALNVTADGAMLVGDGSTDPVAESGATLRTSIGVGTTDNVLFANITGSNVSASVGKFTTATIDNITGNTTSSGDFGADGDLYVGGRITGSSGATFVGSVGIGTTTPGSSHAKANKLVVGGGSACGIGLYAGANEGWYAFSRDNANNTDAYDGGMSYDGSRNLKFHTNAGATRLTIDGSGNSTFAGNVGIGVAPTHAFNLQGTGTVEARFRSTDGDMELQISSDTDELQDSILNFMSGTSGRGQIIYDHNPTAASQAMKFKVGDAAINAMTISGSGKVAIGINAYGTAAASASLSTLCVSGSVEIFQEYGKHPSLYFVVGDNTAGATGVDNITTGQIKNNIYNAGANDLYSQLDFYAAAQNVVKGPIMSVKGTANGGDVGIGTTAPTAARVLHVKSTVAGTTTKIENAHGSTPYGPEWVFSAADPDNNSQYFLHCEGNGTTRLIIYSDGDVQNNDNAYGSTSDSRIKQGIRDSNSQWDDIKAMKVRNFKRNADVAKYGENAWEQIGVISQELEASGMDKLVREHPAQLDEITHSEDISEGDMVKSVQYSIIYMKAIKALQEAMAKIETLETKVTALENA